MKKYIQILLVTCLALSMTACGSTEVDETVVMQDDIVAENDTTEEIEDIKEDIIEDVTEEVEEADITEEVEETTETEEEITGYYPGTFTETGYETEFLGFRYTTPEGYVLATPEELAELMGTTLEALNESGDITALQKKYTEITTIYEMMVSDSIGAVNANIILEKTVVPINLYIEAAKEQLAGVSDMTITIKDAEAVELAGESYIKLSADVLVSDMSVYQDYYFRQLDGYMMLITVTYVEGFEAEKETMLSGFAAF